jgi:hypothetical protein
MKGISELIRMESRLNETRFKALFADIDAIKRQLEALPRAIAETIAPKRRKR